MLWRIREGSEGEEMGMESYLEAACCGITWNYRFFVTNKSRTDYDRFGNSPIQDILSLTSRR